MPPRRAPSPVRILEQVDQGRRPGGGSRLADEDAGPAVVDQVGVAADAGDDAGQGGGHRLEERVAHPLGHAGQDEDVGRAEVVGRVGHGAGELDAIGDAQTTGELGQGLAIAARARRGSGSPAVCRATAVQASSRSGRFFWGWSRPVKTTRGRGSRVDSTDAGAGVEMLGVDAAGHADHPPGGHTQIEPLALDLGRDRREGRVPEDDLSERFRPTSPAQLVGLAVVARAGRLDERGDSREPRREPAPWRRPPTAPGGCGRRRAPTRNRRSARITPATKLRANRGPRSMVRIQRWMKSPRYSSSSIG